MILISHRGNTLGKNKKEENKPSYIEKTINEGFEVEIDIWCNKNKLYLGHDDAQYVVQKSWLEKYKEKHCIHCKDLASLSFFSTKLKNKDFNFFFHDNEDATLTSKGYLWIHPGKQPVNNSIAVLPELYNDDFSRCIGICSDLISNY